MNLLSVTDLLPRSGAAVERAHQLREALGARLTLVHVVEPDADDSDPLEQRLLRANTRLAEVRGARANVDLVLRCGRAASVVAEVARSRSARLMVIGPHDEHRLADALRGTFSERLVANASCPVLIVRRPVRGPYRKVLLALDGSPSTRHILRAVDSLGIEAGAELSVVHAHEPPYEAMMGSVGVAPVSVTGYAAASMDQAAQVIKTRLQQNGADPARYRLVMVDARPAFAIQRAVRTLRPELLVLGTRGHGRFRRAVLGSTAHEALQASECDVLLVPDAAIRAARRQAHARHAPGGGPGEGPAAA
jgi:universal stress protein E